MKNMLKVVEEFLKKNKDGATFNEIFDNVKVEMKETWTELFPTKIKQIEEEKIGELYTLMCVDGRFVRNNEHKWFLVDVMSYDDVKRMKINIGEVEELETME